MSDNVNLRITPGSTQMALHAMARFGRQRVAIEPGTHDILVQDALWVKVLPAKEFFAGHGVRVEVT